MQVFTLHREPEHVAYSTFKKRSTWDLNLRAQRRASAESWNQFFGQFSLQAWETQWYRMEKTAVLLK
jgi:hypothetical protein